MNSTQGQKRNKRILPKGIIPIENCLLKSTHQGQKYGIIICQAAYLKASNKLVKHLVNLSGYSVKETSWFGLKVTYKEGHEWVCDGYSSTQYPTFSTLYFHMNWGWHEVWGGNDYNGWYAYNSWAISNGYNFQYYQRAITNIHP